MSLSTLAQRRALDLNPVFLFHFRKFWSRQRTRKIICGCVALTVLGLILGWGYRWFWMIRPATIFQRPGGGFLFYSTVNTFLPIWDPVTYFYRPFATISRPAVQLFGIVVNFLIPGFLALSVGLDRENGNIEQTRVTPLSAGQIVRGKVTAALLPFAIPAIILLSLAAAVDYTRIFIDLAKQSQDSGSSAWQSTYRETLPVRIGFWTVTAWVHLLAVGMISVWAGLRTQRAWQAVGLAYATVIAARLLRNFIWFFYRPFWPSPVPMIVGLAIECATVALAYFAACRLLRRYT